MKPRKVLSSFRNLVSPVAVLFSRHADAGARALLSRAFAFASVCLRVFVCVVVSSRIRRRRRSQRSVSVSVCVFYFSPSFLSFSHLFLTAVQFLLFFHFQTARLQPVSLCFHSLTTLPPYLTVPCIIASSPSSSSLVVSLCDSSHWTFLRLRLRLLSLSSPVFVCLPLLLAPAASTRRAITLQYQRFLGISSVVS